jgi:hypothetical protein
LSIFEQRAEQTSEQLRAQALLELIRSLATGGRHSEITEDHGLWGGIQGWTRRPAWETPDAEFLE